MSDDEAAVAARLAELRSPDPTVRAGALTWLAAHGPDALTSEQADLLNDADTAVRAAAAVVFRASPDPALVQGARLALRELLTGDREARHAGLRAAAALGSPFLAPRLLPYLDHLDAETRRLTLLALAAPPLILMDRLLLESAARGALDDPDAGVREAAGELLAAVRREAAAAADRVDSGGEEV